LSDRQIVLFSVAHKKNPERGKLGAEDLKSCWEIDAVPHGCDQMTWRNTFAFRPTTATAALMPLPRRKLPYNKVVFPPSFPSSQGSGSKTAT
jgi:hypothetical protein